MRTWLALARLGALHHFAWRLDVLLTLASAAMVLVLNASLWSAALAEGDGAVGLTADALVTYVVVAWTFSRVTGTRLDDNLSNRVSSGQIASDLLKPLDLVSYLVARDVGRALTTLLLTAAPLILLGWTLFPLAWPARAEAWAVVALSLSLGVVVGSHVAVLVGLAAVRMKRATGLIQLKELGVGLASGALVPLPLVPDGMRHVLLALPFQAMAHTPATLFVEDWTPEQAVWLLGVQMAWAMVLVVAARFAWQSTLQHLTVEGG